MIVDFPQNIVSKEEEFARDLLSELFVQLRKMINNNSNVYVAARDLEKSKTMNLY